MFNGLGNLAQIMKSAQQLQGQMRELQQKLGELRVEGTAGAGLVTVIANGQLTVLECRIDASLLPSNDQEMLQDLIVAATNQALEKARQAAADEMSKITGGLGNLSGVGNMLSHLTGNGQ